MNTSTSQQKPYSHGTLFKLCGFDLVAAASSSTLVSPFIAVVDRAIIENLNGKRTLGQGLIYGTRSVLTRPHKFIASPQFQLVLGLYFSTYATANIVDTTTEYYGVDPKRTSMIKFIATTAVNMGLCIYKDRSFARMFGTVASHPLPKLSYVLFALRDSMTIAASFNAPSFVLAWLQERPASSSRLINYWKSNLDKASVATQLACPALIQFFSTPLHLLSLDLYNRPTATIPQRMSLMRAAYLKSALARIARIGPAFGVGGIGNTMVRNHRSFIWKRQQTPTTV